MGSFTISSSTKTYKSLLSNPKFIYLKPTTTPKIVKFGIPFPLQHQLSSTFKMCTKAVLSSGVTNPKPFPKIASESTGPVPIKQLLDVVLIAAKTGAEVVMEAVNKPRNISYKGVTDLVTDTDKMSEAAILGVVAENFGDHLILGEEGGIIGNTSSDYLWCIDPLDPTVFVEHSLAMSGIRVSVGTSLSTAGGTDAVTLPVFMAPLAHVSWLAGVVGAPGSWSCVANGTTNFAHGYPSFAVSVGVLFRGKPVAAAVVEFVGGPHCWNTRTFSASAGGGAFCNGNKVHVSQTDLVERSLLVTGFGYEHDDAWLTNIGLFKEFTDISRGVRRLGAAAVDMCHVALGIVEAYWEYRLKPWDMAAGVLIVEEAGGTVTRMDGEGFCVFDRSVLVSNGLMHAKLLERISPATEKLKNDGMDVSLWFKPENYNTDL
ncbi:hypothetical protein GIB67_035241 [Kingdonia uniflora]|uniref:inositol-phosphate phosphatase n=1 Tax=Kingdonia uniflora TaxID=39325 RepID=A0A7J7KXR9_9MAGN|nr:hypothetical protein GIB67_035241 [Kingdonia uniflora]